MSRPVVPNATYSPRGVGNRPVGLRLAPNERACLIELATQEGSSLSAEARLLVIEGLERRGFVINPIHRA